MPHYGPNYGVIPSGCVMDPGSATHDNAQGGFRVEWTDRFNRRHLVEVGEQESVVVVFPIPYGGDWIWFQQQDPRQQRTGFNAAVTWVQAVL